MKKYLLFLLVLLVFVVGCTQQVGEQGEDFAKDYLEKYFSEEYINENFEITKLNYAPYDPSKDLNCYAYKVKIADTFVEPEKRSFCLKGHKPVKGPASYSGPQEKFELQITQEEAERIMLSNGCTLSSFKDGRPAFYVRNDDFWWGGYQELQLALSCKVDAETGEFTRG